MGESNRVSKKKQENAGEEPEFYNDITKVLPAAWDFMEEGVRDRHSLAHTPVVTTLDVDGGAVRCTLRCPPVLCSDASEASTTRSGSFTYSPKPSVTQWPSAELILIQCSARVLLCL